MNNSEKMMEAVKEAAEHYQKKTQEAIKAHDEGASINDSDSFAKKIKEIIAFSNFIIRFDCIFNDSLIDKDDNLCITSLMYYQSMSARIYATVDNYNKLLKLLDASDIPDNVENLAKEMVSMGVESLKKYSKVIE